MQRLLWIVPLVIASVAAPWIGSANPPGVAVVGDRIVVLAYGYGVYLPFSYLLLTQLLLGLRETAQLSRPSRWRW